MEAVGFFRITHNDPHIQYAFFHPDLSREDQFIFQRKMEGLGRKRVKKQSIESSRDFEASEEVILLNMHE